MTPISHTKTRLSLDEPLRTLMPDGLQGGTYACHLRASLLRDRSEGDIPMRLFNALRYAFRAGLPMTSPMALVMTPIMFLELCGSGLSPLALAHGTRRRHWGQRTPTRDRAKGSVLGDVATFRGPIATVCTPRPYPLFFNEHHVHLVIDRRAREDSWFPAPVAAQAVLITLP